MLSEDIKETIRAAYTRLTKEKSLLPRPGQRQMIAEIANSLARMGNGDGEQPPHCVIEAGTGTGKTIAYALAAIPVALAADKRLVIATATIALQEQLVFKDLPDIHRHSGLEFDFVLAKGRRHYVCLRDLDKWAGAGAAADSLFLYPDEQEPPSADDAHIYSDMITALGRGEWDGDRDSWDRQVPDNVWRKVTTDHRGCSGNRCQHRGACSFFRARDGLRGADVIVTNHDLVLSDLALGGGAILPEPEETIYIFDEGHHLADKALDHFSLACQLGPTRQWLDDSRAQLGKAGARLVAAPSVIEQLEKAAPLMEGLDEPLIQAEQRLPEWLDPEAAQYLAERAGPKPGRRGARPGGKGRGYYSGDSIRSRFPQGAVPEGLQSLARHIAGEFDLLHNSLKKLVKRTEDVLDGTATGVDAADAENWYAAFGTMLARAEQNLALWQDYADAPSTAPTTAPGAPLDLADPAAPPTARWIEILFPGGRGASNKGGGAGDAAADGATTDSTATDSPTTETGGTPSKSGDGIGYKLCSSPVLAADILKEQLWDRAAAVVATSATMTALNSFERFILHAGAPPNSVFKVVPSPFDHSNAVLCVPAMDSDPGDHDQHTAELAQKLPRWLDPGGGSLVLFASRRQLNGVYDALPAEWQARILVQGDHSKAEILHRHRQAVDAGKGSVIFGLASFAEGVDLPGRYCEHVVIAKVPFAVPDSPIESALGEWVQGRGGNPFMEISVPDASLRLVQAAGRLLRTEGDSGRVTIGDRRLVTRRYGKALLDALPPFKRDIQ